MTAQAAGVHSGSLNTAGTCYDAPNTPVPAAIRWNTTHLLMAPKVAQAGGSPACSAAGFDSVQGIYKAMTLNTCVSIPKDDEEGSEDESTKITAGDCPSDSTSDPAQTATSAPATETSAPSTNSSGNTTTLAPGTITKDVVLELKVTATVTDDQAKDIAKEMAKTAGAKVVAEALNDPSISVLVERLELCGATCECSKTPASAATKAECDVCYAEAPPSRRRRTTSEMKRKLTASAKEFTVKVTIMDISDAAATTAKNRLMTAAASGGALSDTAVATLAKTAAAAANVNVTFTVTKSATPTVESSTTTTTSGAFAMLSAGFGLIIAALLF